MDDDDDDAMKAEDMAIACLFFSFYLPLPSLWVPDNKAVCVSTTLNAPGKKKNATQSKP